MSALSKQRLKEKTIGSFVAVPLVDAMGLPLECKSPAIIRQTFGYVDTFVSNSTHKYKEVSRRAKGTFSDDGQLHLAMSDSLARSGGYNLPDIRKAHVEAYDGKWGKRLGWGRTSREAVEKIKKGESPSYIPEGAGNAPPTKIAPLAIYCVYKCLQTKHGKFTNSFNTSLLKKCKEITMITHGDPRCIVGAYCQARMVIRALQDEIPEFTRQIAKLFVEDATFAEKKLNIPNDLSNRMKKFLAEDMFNLDTNVVSTRICKCQSSFIMNSYPLVSYCASKYLPCKNFRHAICQTINAGADADSNGAMVGAIVAAYLGWSEIPLELIKGLKQWKLVLKQAKQFELSL